MVLNIRDSVNKQIEKDVIIQFPLENYSGNILMESGPCHNSVEDLNRIDSRNNRSAIICGQMYFG